MYKLIRTAEEYKEIMLELHPDKILFCDTETYTNEGKSDGGLYGKVRLFQLYQEGMTYAIIIDCMFIPLDIVLGFVKPFHHVYHNSSYDLHTINLHTDDLWLPHEVDDTIYLSRLVLFQKGSRFDFHSCLAYAGLEDDMIKSIDKKANQKADWGGVLTPTMLTYAACDVLYLSLLWAKVNKALETEAYKLDIFNLKYAVEYSRRGIPTDPIAIKSELLDATNKLESTLLLLPVNPNSPKQCCEYLGTTSSDKDVLVKLALEGHEGAALIKSARELTKKVNFCKKYSRPIIKGFYNPSAAVTGRWSCTGGDVFDHSNLQQIPKELLYCLLAMLGKIFIYKDYAGLELRMAVCWIGDPTMERMIRDGIDLHTYTASVLFGKPMDQVTKLERNIGKICNFMLIYGGGAYRLQAECRDWGISLTIAECKTHIGAWMGEYTSFPEWHKMTRRHLKTYGYMDVITALGREVRTYKDNDALNTPIQGSSSEVTKMSLKYLKERYEDEYLVSTIHDSNTLLQDEKDADLWVGRLNECMCDAWYYVIKDTAIPDLPMPPEAVAGKRWKF